METDDLIPEEIPERIPLEGGALEVATFLQAAGFIYVRSCLCCGHWFLCTEFPLEVSVSIEGRSIEAFSLNPQDAAFAQMIIPPLDGRRHLYVSHFTERFAHAWEFCSKYGQTYTVPYNQAPFHDEGLWPSR